MAKQAKVPVKRTSTSLRNKLLLIPALAFLIKLSIIARIQGFDWYASGNGDMAAGLKTLLDNKYLPAHVWYGADAENYLYGVLGLLKDGLQSTEGTLHYWPAGYPLLIWVLGFLGQGSTLALIAVLQCLLYFVACAFFVDQIRQSRLVSFSVPIALALTLNPTLALNTISIGYELPTASLTLIAVSCMMRYFRLQNGSILTFDTSLASIAFSLATLMQPRLILFAFLFMSMWALAKFRVKMASALFAFSLAITLVSPGLMVYRNSQAMGFYAISTNLGVTMNIGAGEKASGGYDPKNGGVACPEISGDAAKQDSQKVKCVLKWYLNNPAKAIKLFWNKSIYFWSPWYGPVANGTMARNPWRINHPLNETVKTESGANMVYGATGKLISWLWLLTSLFFLFWGFLFLWRAGGLERLWGAAAFSVVVVNWLSSMATIGDNRFRIPTMTLSLTLQVIGFTSLFLNKRKRLVGSGTVIDWPGLHWKRKSETDNLQP
jgi:hypothetical protein